MTPFTQWRALSDLLSLIETRDDVSDLEKWLLDIGSINAQVLRGIMREKPLLCT